METQGVNPNLDNGVEAGVVQGVPKHGFRKDPQRLPTISSFQASIKAQPVTCRPVWRSDRQKVTLSPTPRGSSTRPFLLVAAWPLLAPIWCAKTKKKNLCTATVSVPTLSVWGKKKKNWSLGATEHQLL